MILINGEPRRYLPPGKCPRCGRKHRGVRLRRLSNPHQIMRPYWGMCPRTHQPIVIIDINAGNSPAA